MVKELLFDYITGEIIYTSKEAMVEEIEYRKENYDRDNIDIVVGKDWFSHTGVWFIYEINNPRNISRRQVEKDTENYFEDVK